MIRDFGLRIGLICALTLITSGGVQAQATGDTSESAETDTTKVEKVVVEQLPGIEVEENWKLPRGAKEIGLEFGFAPMQPTFLSGREEYDTDGRKLALGSIRWGRVIGTTKGITFQYLFEAIPVAFAMKNEVRNPDFRSAAETSDVPQTIRTNTYGMAINPAGFRFIFLPNRRLKPFVQTSAGFIFSKKPIPIPESPSYNFAADFGAGLMYSVTKKQTINFGYRYFHISNMNIGEINPGYNANVFYVGYSFFYK